MVQVYVEDCYKWLVGTHDTFFCLISSTMSKMVSQSGSLRSELVALSNGIQHTAGCRGSYIFELHCLWADRVLTAPLTEGCQYKQTLLTHLTGS